MPKPFPYSYFYIEGLNFAFLRIKGGGGTDGGIP
ncbi:hypothetical protein ICU_02022 [Bacillus cereus BAG2X1-1]|nr:hypothetical protein ICU_02022 [Bacillus cereus BAG2X1-1]